MWGRASRLLCGGDGAARSARAAGGQELACHREIRIDTEYGHKQTLTKECHVRERQVMEDAMSMSQAIKSLADELKDTVFSHFQPKVFRSISLVRPSSLDLRSYF